MKGMERTTEDRQARRLFLLLAAGQILLLVMILLFANIKYEVFGRFHHGNGGFRCLYRSARQPHYVFQYPAWRALDAILSGGTQRQLVFLGTDAPVSLLLSGYYLRADTQSAPDRGGICCAGIYCIYSKRSLYSAAVYKDSCGCVHGWAYFADLGSFSSKRMEILPNWWGTCFHWGTGSAKGILYFSGIFWGSGAL